MNPPNPNGTSGSDRTNNLEEIDIYNLDGHMNLTIDNEHDAINKEIKALADKVNEIIKVIDQISNKIKGEK